MDTPEKEDIVIEEFHKLAEGFLKEYKRANDLRTVEISLELLRAQADGADRSIEFEQLESLAGELVKCGK